MYTESGSMRLAMLSVHSCPVGNIGEKDTGGMSVYIRELAGTLCRQGHTVDVFTRIHDPSDPQIVGLNGGARLIHIKAGQEQDMHKLALYSYLPDFACNLERYRKSNGLHYDLVFSHYWLSSWVGQYLQAWWQVPHVTMFHTLGAIKNSVGIGEEEPELRIVMEGEAVQQCHRIITATEKEKGEIVRHYGAVPEKVGVVPCGVNMELFQPSDKRVARQQLGLKGEKILLFVGRIDPLKGIERLLQALPQLKDEKRARLLIVGGDEDGRDTVPRLRAMAQGLNLGERITFGSRVKHEALPLYYSAADVTVVPSYYESFGLVALESLACGTPVVTTDVGDMKRIIRQGVNGYVLADNDPRELAEKIDGLLSRLQPTLESAGSIRESVRDYSWENIAAAIAGEFSHVLSLEKTPVA